MKEIKITEKAHKQIKRLFSSRHTVNTDSDFRQLRIR